MKKIDLGQTLQFLGNAGIIVGILLLVYELNQNRDLMRAQTRNELSQGLIEILLELTSDEERANLLYRGNDGEDLTDYEYRRYANMTIVQLRYHENVHYQYRNGLYDEVEFLAQREQWRNTVFTSEGLVTVFCLIRSGLSPEFVAEIDGLLTTYRCE